MKNKITALVALTLMTLSAQAGAPGDATSNPYALCVGSLSNQQKVEVEIRSWSFPFRLTGTVLLGNVSEPVGFQHNSNASQLISRQSRPTRIAAHIQLQRVNLQNLTGTIEIAQLGNSSKISGNLNCKYVNR